MISPKRDERKGLVKGDHYDSSIAAEIITNRFGYHQPFYRLQDMFAASGWTPSRSTLSNLQSSAAQLIEPFHKYLITSVLTDSVIGTDDTGVKLLLPKVLPGVDPLDPKSTRVHQVISTAMANGQSHIKAKFWAYRGVEVPINVFDFTVSRHRDGPDEFFIDSGYHGTLLGDCYGAILGLKCAPAATSFTPLVMRMRGVHLKRQFRHMNVTAVSSWPVTTSSTISKTVAR